MTFDIAVDAGNRLRLDVIKIVMIDRVVADARTDQELGIRDRLAASF